MPSENILIDAVHAAPNPLFKKKRVAEQLMPEKVADQEVLNRSIGRGLAVLQIINRRHSCTLTHIAEESGLPYPTARRIVHTLVEVGMVERAPQSKNFRPTALVATLSVGYQRENHLAKIARPLLEKLTERILWPVYVSSRVGMKMMVQLSTDSMTSLTFSRHNPGYTTPLLESSSGKAYMAFCEPNERQLVIKGIRKQTPAQHRENLENRIELELTAIRKTGYASARYHLYTELPRKTSGISVPIMGKDNYALATLSMIFFASALSPEAAAKQFLAEIQSTASQISEELVRVKI